MSKWLGRTKLLIIQSPSELMKEKGNKKVAGGLGPFVC